MRLALVGWCACSTAGEPNSSLEWVTVPAEGFTVAVLERDRSLIPFFLATGASGRGEIASFFDRSFQSDYVVRVFPDRATLAAHWRQVWRAPGLDEGCWAIAAARQDEVTFLSPAAWAIDACGHDARDTAHVRLVLTHELVHVLHDQSHADLGRVAQAMPWFVEGLAVFASGQLLHDYEGLVRQLVASGDEPTRLSEIWIGPLRYAIAGSVVSYLDQLIGRPRLAGLLAVSTEAEVLVAAGMGEADFLAGWRAAVLASSLSRNQRLDPAERLSRRHEDLIRVVEPERAQIHQ